ncbi:MAG TPA: transposase [Chloroflexia bacterium]|nr:transposase [Chloroflexia bacterium]
MRQVLTAKLKLATTPAQHESLRATQLAYRDALNATSRYSFDHGKISNPRKLHKAMYGALRGTFGLPSQLACSVCRQVGATYKSLWTRCKQNAAQRQAGLTKKRYKGLDQAPRYVAPTLTYTEGRDYGFKTGQTVSLGTLCGRIVVPYTGYDKHTALLHHGARIGAAKLWYDARRKQFYLLVSLVLEITEPAPASQQAVVGVDVGMRYLAVTATPTGQQHFFSGRAARHRADHYARKRKQLQAKDTRSAQRRLRQLNGRERRFRLDVNHSIAQAIVTTHPQAVIGLEALSHIRERTNRHHCPQASTKQRRANRRQSSWSFASLQAMISYKATLSGSVAIKVDAEYTSQACPRCGQTGKQNRPHDGLGFACTGCDYRLHADLVGARNVALRTLLVRQDWISTGCLSTSPDTLTDEAKAARLQRYSELRWRSSVNMPSAKADGG